MIVKVTRPQLKKILHNHRVVEVHISTIKNGIFWGGYYVADVSTMEEAEQAMVYASRHGWKGKLYFGAAQEYLQG
jgi:hypothetical protein